MALSLDAIVSQVLLAAIKSQFIALCQANGLPVTSFIPGDPTERWLDITPRLMAAVVSDPLTQMARGLFLDLATDPGDVAADGTPDMSADQTPRAGFLSALGLSWFGTTRREQTYAALTVTVQNQTSVPTTPFAPFNLSFTTTDAPKSDGGRPTYQNTVDPAVYTGIGGTLTLAPGASATFSLLADQIGTYGSASANSMSCTTESFGTLTVTSSTIAIGTTRESAPLYRARCRTAADAHSPGGPLNAYLRAMNTAVDGTPLQRYDGSGPVNITAAYVSPSSATGAVTMYVAGLAGAASIDQTDVDTANGNILGLPLGTLVAPIGVKGDTVALGPATYGSSEAFPAGTPSIAMCIDDTIAVTYSVRIKGTSANGLVPGTYSTPGTGAPAAVFAAIAAQIGSDLYAAGINGKDFNGTSGLIYTDDLIYDVRAGYPGLSNPVVTTPSGSTTTVALGHFPTPGTLTGTLVVT